MKIAMHQMHVLNDYMTDVFVNKTITFLREGFKDWVGEKSDVELTKYIGAMMEFAKKHHIGKQINMQKLMQYHILHRFDIPLHKNLEAILSHHNLTEHKRMENFYLCLCSKRYQLIEISLDTPLQN